MDFRSTKVKELFANEKASAVVKELAPNLMKYPIKLFNNKKVAYTSAQAMEKYSLLQMLKNGRK